MPMNRRDTEKQGRNDSLAGRGVWQYMVNGECMGEYLISEAEDKCAFVGTTNNSDSLHIGVGVKSGRTRYEFVSSVVTTPHTAPVVSVLVAERSGSDLIQLSGSGPVPLTASSPSIAISSEVSEKKADDVRWVVSGYPYTLALVTRLYSTLSAVLKNSAAHFGDLSGIFEWRDVESGTVPVHYMLLHIPNTSLFASPFLKATEHVVDMVLQVVVNVADGWSEVGVAKFYRSGEGRKKGILRGRVDMIRTSMSEQGHSLKSLRFRPRVLYVDGPEIKDHEERRVWLKTSPVSPIPAPLPTPAVTEEGAPAVPVKPAELKDPDTKPVVEESEVPQIKALLERLIPSFYTMLKACDTSRARKYLQEMDGEQRKKFLNTPGPDLTEFQTYPPLLLSSRWASPELAKFLVAQGADVQQSLMVEGRSTNALHHAIAIADPSNQGWELVKYFVEKCRIEIDVLALDWAHNRVRGGSSKAKTAEQIAYLWSKVPVKRRKDLAAAFAVPIGNRPAPPLVFLPAASAAPFRPEVRFVSAVTTPTTAAAAPLLVTPLAAVIPSIAPKQLQVESKSGNDNWRSATAAAPLAPWALAPAAPAPATAAVRRGNFGGVAPAAPYRQSQLETAAAPAVAVVAPQPLTQSKALPEQTATGSRYVPPALRKQQAEVVAPAPVVAVAVAVPAKVAKSSLKAVKKGPSSHATTSTSSLQESVVAVPASLLVASSGSSSKKVPKSGKSPLAPSLPHSASLALAQAHQLQLMHDRAKAKAQLTRTNPLALLAHAKAAQATATALAIQAQKAAKAQAMALTQPAEAVSWGRFGGC